MALEAYTKSQPEAITAYNTYDFQRTTGSRTSGSNSRSTRIVGSSLSGYRNPAFRDQIKRGLAATTPMSASSVRVKEFSAPYYESYYPNASWPSGIKWIWESFGSDFLGQIASLSNPVTTLASTVDSMAKQKFYSKASSFNGLTVLGELKETVHMLRSPAAALRAGVGAYLKNAKKIRDSSIASARTLKAAQRDYRKAISGSWLEYNFGWRPFVNDLSDILQTYNKSLKDPRIETIRVSQTLEGSAPETYVSGLAVHGGSSGVYKSYHYSSGVTITAGIKPLVSTTSGPLETFGLIPENFVPTAWQLAPWSFLLDYFINVGGVLDSWATANRLSFAYCSITTRNLTTYNLRSLAYQKTYITAAKEGVMVVESKTVSRSAPSSIPIPSLQAQIKLSDSRLLNIGALLNERGSDLAFRAKRR